MQGFARHVLVDRMVDLAQKMRELRMAATVHDDAAAVGPADDPEAVGRRARAVLETPPAWASDMPLKVDAGYGRSYAEAKPD